MSTQQLEHLVRMANQIAANVSTGGDTERAAGRVLDHIRRFWTSDMCHQLVQYREQGGEDLTPAVVLALDELSREDLA